MDRTVYLSITVLCLGVLTIIFDVLLFILNYISEKPLSFSHPLRKSSIIARSHDLCECFHFVTFSERDEIELNLRWTCKKSTWCWPYLWIHNDFRKMSKFWSGFETILNSELLFIGSRSWEIPDGRLTYDWNTLYLSGHFSILSTVLIYQKVQRYFSRDLELK